MSVYVPLLFNLGSNQWNPEASHQRYLSWVLPATFNEIPKELLLFYFLIQFCSVFFLNCLGREAGQFLRALRIEREAEIAEEQRQLEEKKKRKQNKKEKQKEQHEKEKLTPHACNYTRSFIERFQEFVRLKQGCHQLQSILVALACF